MTNMVHHSPWYNPFASTSSPAPFSVSRKSDTRAMPLDPLVPSSAFNSCLAIRHHAQEHSRKPRLSALKPSFVLPPTDPIPSSRDHMKPVPRRPASRPPSSTLEKVTPAPKKRPRRPQKGRSIDNNSLRPHVLAAHLYQWA